MLPLDTSTCAGAELRKLYDEYFEAVRKNLDIENACDSLQDEVRDHSAQALEQCTEEEWVACVALALSS